MGNSFWVQNRLTSDGNRPRIVRSLEHLNDQAAVCQFGVQKQSAIF